jgi:hypothetical protein
VSGRDAAGWAIALAIAAPVLIVIVCCVGGTLAGVLHA